MIRSRCVSELLRGERSREVREWHLLEHGNEKGKQSREELSFCFSTSCCWCPVRSCLSTPLDVWLMNEC